MIFSILYKISFEVLRNEVLMGLLWNWLKKQDEHVLTDIFTTEPVDEGSQIEIAGDDSHLVRRLIGKVKCLLIGATEEQEPGASVAVVNGANVQRRVTRRVLGVHLAAVEKKVLQVRNQPVSTRLF